jgi:hypothetical protein
MFAKLKRLQEKLFYTTVRQRLGGRAFPSKAQKKCLQVLQEVRQDDQLYAFLSLPVLKRHRCLCTYCGEALPLDAIVWVNCPCLKQAMHPPCAREYQGAFKKCPMCNGESKVSVEKSN